MVVRNRPVASLLRIAWLWRSQWGAICSRQPHARVLPPRTPPHEEFAHAASSSTVNDSAIAGRRDRTFAKVRGRRLRNGGDRVTNRLRARMLGAQGGLESRERALKLAAGFVGAALVGEHHCEMVTGARGVWMLCAKMLGEMGERARKLAFRLVELTAAREQ